MKGGKRRMVAVCVRVGAVAVLVAVCTLELRVKSDGGHSRLHGALAAQVLLPDDPHPVKLSYPADDRTEVQGASAGPLTAADPASAGASPVPATGPAGTPTPSSTASPGTPLAAAVPAGPAVPDSPETAEVFAFVNDARKQAGVPPLVYDATLAHYAELQTDWMATNGKLCHSTDCNPAAVPTTYAIWGENVGWVAEPSPAVLDDALMASSAHRSNILDTDFAEIGLSWAQGHLADRPGTFWFLTEQFGSAPPGARSGRVR